MIAYHLIKYHGNMEWTKETLIGTCILYTGKGSISDISKFYENYGFEGLSGTARPYVFIGVPTFEEHSNNPLVSICSESSWFNKVIKLPSKPRRKFPREMMVSDDKIKWEKRLVAGTINSSSKYVSYINEEFQEGQVFKFLLAWKYAKEIE